jgi:hypothetical protein
MTEPAWLCPKPFLVLQHAWCLDRGAVHSGLGVVLRDRPQTRHPNDKRTTQDGSLASVDINELSRSLRGKAWVPDLFFWFSSFYRDVFIWQCGGFRGTPAPILVIFASTRQNVDYGRQNSFFNLSEPSNSVPFMQNGMERSSEVCSCTKYAIAPNCVQ